MTFFALNIYSDEQLCVTRRRAKSEEDAQYVLGTQKNVEISRKLGLVGLTQKMCGVVFSLFLSCLRYPEILLSRYEFVSFFLL